MKEGEGIIIDIRKYSNTSLIVKIFSKEDGKVSGFIKGGQVNAKNQISLSSLVSFKISKRLEEHLGMLKIETIKSFSLLNLKDKFKTIAINSLRETLFFLMQDGSPDEEIYELVIDLLHTINSSEERSKVLRQYALFELELLSLLGFGIDFEKCALSGKMENLFFISPATGRCANFEAGKEFKDKLFEIPVLFGNMESLANKEEDVSNAFKINSHFLFKVANFEKITSRNMLLKYIFTS